MKLPELHIELRDKKIRPYYIFTGEEIAIMDIYINLIGDIKEVKPQRVDSLQDIFQQMTRQSFSSGAKIYVISDDKDYLKQEELWEDMRAGNIQKEHTIIFIYNNLDKRTKFYKKYKDDLTEFNKLDTNILAAYIMRNISLSNRAAMELAKMCNNDYSQILMESDKLVRLSEAANIGIEESFNRAKSFGLIYQPIGEIVFELVDNICRRNSNAVFKLLEGLKEQGDNVLGVISLIYNNFRSMLLVQSAGNSKDLSSRTGLTGWEIKLAKEKGQRYQIGELVRALRIIRETEKGIKTGKIEMGIALDYIMVMIL